jgi:hypothetical protein
MYIEVRQNQGSNSDNLSDEDLEPFDGFLVSLPDDLADPGSQFLGVRGAVNG